MSENPGVPVLFGGHKLPPLFEIGLTDLPKSGGAMALSATPGAIPLSIFLLLVLFLSIFEMTKCLFKSRISITYLNQTFWRSYLMDAVRMSAIAMAGTA